MSLRLVAFCFLTFSCLVSPGAADTIVIQSADEAISIAQLLRVLEDPESASPADSITGHTGTFPFRANTSEKLNFGFSTSTWWLTFTLQNNLSSAIHYYIEIKNPDLDYVNYYETENGVRTKSILTGELRDVASRDFLHHNFVFQTSIEPNKAKTYFISINNGGHALFIPIEIITSHDFYARDSRETMVNWLLYGVLFFILFYIFYLSWSTADRVNLYYALYVLSATLFLLYYDGYFYLLNPPQITESFKYIFPSLYIIFLLSFTQAFTDLGRKYERIFRVFKIAAFIIGLFYIFDYPVSLVSDIGITLMVILNIVIIITISIAKLNLKYPPSIFFLAGYILMLAGMVAHQLKELNILPANLLINNSIKIGLTAECLLLTIAVLERVRINTERANTTIKQNLEKIELQNRELEFVNTELEKLSIVASETVNSVAIYSRNGHLDWCNSGFERFYNISMEQLIRLGRDTIEQIVPHENIQELFATCLTKKKYVAFETSSSKSKNSKKWMHTTLSPFVHKGEVVKIVAIDTDITNLKNFETKLQEAKEKAEQSDKLKTIFLGNISHEIRTPLNGIIGFSELLEMENISPEKKKSFLGLIRQNGNQLQHIIDDILNISLIESNQLKLNLQDTNLHFQIAQSLAFFENYKNNINKSHLSIRYEAPVDTLACMTITDSHRFGQVMSNLLNNALKFTSEGEITIRLRHSADEFEIAVEDTGIGIDPEKSEIVFERFRQGIETLSRQYGGNGLGLSIARGIVHALGGKIWLDTQFGPGARFCFTIPRVKREENELMPDNSLTSQSAN